jgi:methylmalonyl-CoA mutase
MEEMIRFVRQTYGKRARKGVNLPQFSARKGETAAPCIGITGPGGAGKTTLIDELVLRWLSAQPEARIAILSHDPSIIGKGALLGDRATMIYSQDDRVFMRSLATHGRAGGLSPETAQWIRAMKHGGFDVVFVETVGIGQEAMPFRSKLVDKSIFVMSADYGSQLQLQKIAMLDVADIVVVNKGDLAGAPTALAEVGRRIHKGRGRQCVMATVAKRHRDPGVNQLFEALRS